MTTPARSLADLHVAEVASIEHVGGERCEQLRIVHDRRHDRLLQIAD